MRLIPLDVKSTDKRVGRIQRLLDVAVLDGISLARIGLPGLARVGSAVLAVDDDRSLAHIFLIIGSASRPTGAGGACGIA